MKRVIRLTFAAVLLLSTTFAARFASAQQLSEEDPLGDIAGNMTFVLQRLAQHATGKETQETQARIIQKLDELIERLEREQRNVNRVMQPDAPLPDSVLVQGPGGLGPQQTPKESSGKWVRLPPQQRERILQSRSEGFPAPYQAILEQYYRRLATETPAESRSDLSDESTQP